MGARYTTVHLPGEREADEWARIMYRENRRTFDEWRAWRAGSICAEYAEVIPNWRCTHKNPCVYCRDLR